MIQSAYYPVITASRVFFQHAQRLSYMSRSAKVIMTKPCTDGNNTPLSRKAIEESCQQWQRRQDNSGRGGVTVMQERASPVEERVFLSACVSMPRSFLPSKALLRRRGKWKLCPRSRWDKEFLLVAAAGLLPLCMPLAPQRRKLHIFGCAQNFWATNVQRRERRKLLDLHTSKENFFSGLCSLSRSPIRKSRPYLSGGGET